jgi:glycerophosphoryl diester phosphodiesterase
MNIIGHRGANSLAPENTIESIGRAKRIGVDAIEFDVRASKDGILFLCHDATLSRTHGIDTKIADTNATQLSKIKNNNGEKLPTLSEALDACGSTPAIIECKNGDWAEPLQKVLIEHPKKHLHAVISFNHHELAKFGNLCPEIPLYVLEHRNPFDAINAARIYGFQGIDINYWTLNPLAYVLAWRHKLKIIVFTVNKTWVANFLRVLYPGISLTTDFPQNLQHLRAKKRKSKK